MGVSLQLAWRGHQPVAWVGQVLEYTQRSTGAPSQALCALAVTPASGGGGMEGWQGVLQCPHPVGAALRWEGRQ